MNDVSRITDELLDLAHQVGRPEAGLVLLGEGNLSARIDDDRFWVKASGHNLETLTPEGLSLCSLSHYRKHQKEVEEGKAEWSPARLLVDPDGPTPSVEVAFHAWLLSQPGVQWVLHTHPIHCNGLLCSAQAADFATARLFPDHVVCNGVASALVPYVDPGAPLAMAIGKTWQQFQKEYGQAPNTLLLLNHGIITVGPSAKAAWAASLMAEKAARIYLHALHANQGKPPPGLAPEEILHLAGRPDEHLRQKILGILPA